MTELELATLFHDTYERLAPSFGYETRLDTRAFDPMSANGRLMTAVAGEILAALRRVRVEIAAQRVFEHHRFGTWEPGEKPAWLPRGNSDMQELARAFARTALEDTTGPD